MLPERPWACDPVSRIQSRKECDQEIRGDSFHGCDLTGGDKIACHGRVKLLSGIVRILQRAGNVSPENALSRYIFVGISKEYSRMRLRPCDLIQ
jgi:hypothetical protein